MIKIVHSERSVQIVFNQTREQRANQHYLPKTTLNIMISAKKWLGFLGMILTKLAGENSDYI